jgi:hypothetical protein
MKELTDFCKRIEVTDSMSGANRKPRNGNDNNKSEASGSSKTGKYCKYHRSTSHSTEECRQKKFHDQKPAFKNKTWKKSHHA